MTSRSCFRSVALALFVLSAGWSISGDRIGAHYLAPSTDPELEVLLRAQPIVVLAKVGDRVGSSKKAFEAIRGDIDYAPAFSEEYQHYRLHLARLLKGKLPETFEVRVISGSRNHVALDRAQGQEMLLVLAPDGGLDPQGRPRDSYLITHGAAYVVRDGRFTAVGERGPEIWSLGRASDVIGRFERERERQRAESPEPRDAAVSVYAGEERPDRPEPAPPEAPKLRKGDVAPADALAKAAPRAMENPGGEARIDRPQPGHLHPQPPDGARRSEIHLGRPFAFRPRQLPTGGDPASHACIRGDYIYRYETSGLQGREVWLCCIPPEEILRESFHCADSLFPALFGNSDYTKIRYCSLLHPTASEVTYIPVCIPPPLQAPGLDRPR
jgi:hypothetical protein